MGSPILTPEFGQGLTQTSGPRMPRTEKVPTDTRVSNCMLVLLHLGMAVIEVSSLGGCGVFSAYNLLIRSWNFFPSPATLVTDYFQIHKLIFKMQSGHPRTHL